MAAKYSDTITTRTGSAIEGATVQIFDNGALVALYADNGLTTPLSPDPHTAVSDVDGYVECYLAPGTYTVVQSDGGVTKSFANVQLYDLTANDAAVANTFAKASAIGITPSDTDLGTFTGSTIPDNGSVKGGMQALETALEAGAGGLGPFSQAAAYAAGTVGAKMQSLRVSPTDSPFNAQIAGNGDMSAAIQAVDTFLRTKNGGTILLPPGDVKCYSQVTIDNSSDQPDTPRVSLAGAGGAATFLRGTTGDYIMLQLLGSNTDGGADAMASLSGLYIDKPDKLGTCVDIRRYAHLRLQDLRTNGGNIGLYMLDVQESLLDDVEVRWAAGGIVAEITAGAGFFTAPNALDFINVKVGNCDNFGADIHNPSALNWLGGSIEGNNVSAIGGTATTWGARFRFDNDTYQQGSVGVNLIGVYIENNGINGADVTPTGDLWLVRSANSPLAVNVIGCSFQRHAYYCRNNIRWEDSSSVAGILNLSGNGHRGFSDYTADSTRPYVFIFDTNKVVRVNQQASSLYADATEKPDFSQFMASTREDVPVARCRVNTSGATGALTLTGNSRNIASVTKNATGDCTYTYAYPLATATPVYLVGLLDGQGTWEVTAENQFSVRIVTKNLSGTATDFQVNLLVFGGSGDA